MQTSKRTVPPKKVIVRFAGDLLSRVGTFHHELDFEGDTLRDLIPAVVERFDLEDLLMNEGGIRPYVQIVIDGRFSYTVGGLDAAIRDGATVSFFAFRGGLLPISLPKGTTLRELRARRGSQDRPPDRASQMA